jgi:hydroxyethylthiazole kinase-like uncharacterized protein yjeF
MNRGNNAKLRPMSLSLYRVDELRRIELAAASGLPPGSLMQRAGLAAAETIARHCAAAAGPVVFVCGPGNNGGDGYEAASQLRARGYDVLCVALSVPRAHDAREAFDRYRAGGGSVVETLPDIRCATVVDAMFGIGLERPLGGKFAAAARWIGEQRAPVVALDVPSGLDADTGAWVGDVEGVIATTTVTFIGAKPGLFTGRGCDAAGEVTIAPLGLNAGQAAGRVSDVGSFAGLLGRRRRDSHKGSYGDVAVVGGGGGMTGAALLAARAALRLGAGRVYVDCLGAPDLRFDPMQPELMLQPATGISRADAWIVGCGLGTDEPARSALDAVLRRDQTVVIDADALNLIAIDAGLQARLRARTAVAVLTPHPLEAARLLGATVGDVQRDRVAAALRLAASMRAWVVLKGAGSVIAAADGRYWINPTGTPALATPGTGDVLAGMLGACLAQHVAVAEAIVGAVWLHGAAADDYGGDLGLTAGEIAARAAQVLVRLRAAGATPG